VLLGEASIYDNLTITRRRATVPSNKSEVWTAPLIGGNLMIDKIRQLWVEERGQDVAEYAVMLAVILVIVIGTVKLIGSNANNVFSQVGSSLGTQ
jgi:Flp pilus assembly pilin Flp